MILHPKLRRGRTEWRGWDNVSASGRVKELAGESVRRGSQQSQRKNLRGAHRTKQDSYAERMKRLGKTAKLLQWRDYSFKFLWRKRI